MKNVEQAADEIGEQVRRAARARAGGARRAGGRGQGRAAGAVGRGRPWGADGVDGRRGRRRGRAEGPP